VGGMTPHLLIDAIVRQTTVLIAQLATTAGVRAPLAHVAADVFVSLVEELKDQGLGSKVIADMFGLALRTYHNRVRRYSESATDRGVSLWEAVLRFVRERDVVTRAEVLRRFHADDQATVRAVLKDLVDTGLLFRTGRADRTTFRAAKPEEVAVVDDGQEAAAQFVRVLLHQQGPLAPREISSQLGLKLETVEQALERLKQEGQVQLVAASDAVEPAYQASECVISYGDERGWEAALYLQPWGRSKHRSLPIVGKRRECVGGSRLARRRTRFRLEFSDVCRAHRFRADVRRSQLHGLRHALGRTIG